MLCRTWFLSKIVPGCERHEGREIPTELRFGNFKNLSSGVALVLVQINVLIEYSLMSNLRFLVFKC